jgi:hypothetical protein
MIDDDKIRERAYALWEQKGRQEGGAEEYWHEARQQLEAETPSEETDAFSGGVESSVAPPAPRKRKKRGEA